MAVCAITASMYKSTVGESTYILIEVNTKWSLDSFILKSHLLIAPFLRREVRRLSGQKLLLRHGFWAEADCVRKRPAHCTGEGLVPCEMSADDVQINNGLVFDLIFVCTMLLLQRRICGTRKKEFPRRTSPDPI